MYIAMWSFMLFRSGRVGEKLCWSKSGKVKSKKETDWGSTRMSFYRSRARPKMEDRAHRHFFLEIIIAGTSFSKTLQPHSFLLSTYFFKTSRCLSGINLRGRSPHHPLLQLQTPLPIPSNLLLLTHQKHKMSLRFFPDLISLILHNYTLSLVWINKLSIICH